MPKQYNTIYQNHIFQKIYQKGQHLVAPCLITYLRNNQKSYIRLGITASKKIGKAVQRNRSKRVIVAAFQELCQEYPSLLTQGVDLVFVARSKTSSVKMQVVKASMKQHFIQNKLIQNQPNTSVAKKHANLKSNTSKTGGVTTKQSDG